MQSSPSPVDSALDKFVVPGGGHVASSSIHCQLRILDLLPYGDFTVVEKLYYLYLVDSAIQCLQFYRRYGWDYVPVIEKYYDWFLRGDFRWISRHITEKYTPALSQSLNERALAFRLASDIELIQLRRIIDEKAVATTRTLDFSILHNGICGLPTEIIATIFELVQSKTPYLERSRSLAALSSVSHLFRNVVTGHAELWTDVTTFENANWIKLKLERSRKCELDVTIRGVLLPAGSIPKKSCNVHESYIDLSTLQHLVAACDRWRELRYYLSSQRDEQFLRPMLSNLQLPGLRRFHVEFMSNAASYGTWSMPNLQMIRCTENVPLKPFEQPGKLRSFSLEICAYSEMEDREIVERIFSVLQAPGLAQIRNLELTLRYLEEFYHYPEKLDSLVSPVVLVKVETFVVLFDFVDIEWVLKTIKQIQLPHVRKIEFSVYMEPLDTATFEDACTPAHRGLFEWACKWPLLKEVEVWFSALDEIETLGSIRLEAQKLFQDQVDVAWSRQMHGQSRKNSSPAPVVSTPAY